MKKKKIYGTLTKIVSSEKAYFFDNERNSTTYKFKIIGVKRFFVLKFLKEESKFSALVETIDDELSEQKNRDLLGSPKMKEL